MAWKGVTLDELYRRADFITLHVPKTKDTLGFINAQALAKMKKGVMLVNCSRADSGRAGPG